ncbi:hypothetical protein GCM10010275_55450 [Streptomyces litmocidini]|nr:hypothetical protein GCM10010275_55450 [Streptomyces litmocidini]
MTAQERAEALFEKLDSDSDGQLRPGDIERAFLPYYMGSDNAEKQRAVQSAVGTLVKALLGDEMSDETVSEKQFIAAFASPGFVDKALVPFLVAVVDAGQRDDESSLDLDEWRKWQVRLGLPDTSETMREFQSADSDENILVSLEEYTQFLKKTYTP